MNLSEKASASTQELERTARMEKVLHSFDMEHCQKEPVDFKELYLELLLLEDTSRKITSSLHMLVLSLQEQD